MSQKPSSTTERNRLFTRREFLAGAGVLIATAAGGGVLNRAVGNGVFSVSQGEAYAPWFDLDDLAGTPVDLVRYGILASNSHNTQPWLFRATQSQIDVYADTRRNTGAVDPYLRELYASGGCVLANMLVAAPALGYIVEYSLTPTGDDAHLATLTLARADPVSSPLFEFIPLRHMNRHPYDTERSVATDTLSRIAAHAEPFGDVQVKWITETVTKQRLASLIVEATEGVIADTVQSQASFAWQRQSWDDIQRYRDGITLDCAGQDDFTVTLGKILPPLSRQQSDDYWLASTRDRQVSTAAAFGIICLNDVDDLRQRIEGGIVWQHVHLQLAADGLAAQVLNQIPERIQREQVTGASPYFQSAVAEFTGPEKQALMIFRVGYPTRAPNPSPRRALESVLLPA